MMFSPALTTLGGPAIHDGGIDPAKVPGLLAWYDARFLELPDNTPCMNMADLTGNFPDIARGSTAPSPTFHINGWGYGPAVHFDGVDDMLYTPATLSHADLFPNKNEFTLIGRFCFTGIPQGRWPSPIGVRDGHIGAAIRAGDSQAPDYPLYLHGEIGKNPYDGSAWIGVSQKSATTQYKLNVGAFTYLRGKTGSPLEAGVWHDDGRKQPVRQGAVMEPLCNNRTDLYFGIPVAWNTGPLWFQFFMLFDRYLEDHEVEYLRHA